METPKTIKKGEELKGNVLFTGNQNGKITSSLTILSDAKNQPRLSVPLNAEVFSTPNLVVNPENLHFDLSQNETKVQKLTLSNKGEANLNYEVKFPTGKDWITSSNQVS